MSRGEILCKKVYENDNFFSIFDINPRSLGHSLVISKKHFNNILELPLTSCQELLDCIKNTSLIVLKEKNATGFNVLVNTFKSADQAINHLHVHIIPRRENDKLRLNDN
jgi:histidine triad (HIT) family protein